MNLITLKCPECGADLEIQDDREFIFCQYCGRKIYMDESDVVKLAKINRGIKQDEIDLKKDKDKKFLLLMAGLGIFMILMFILGSLLP
jgi:DNA-directed RNA polymerase subunit RPC12/RpoP